MENKKLSVEAIENGTVIDHIPAGLGLTIVSWLARLTGLLAPPVVGWLADDHGLWVALAYGLLGGLIMVTCWPVLRRRTVEASVG